MTEEERIAGVEFGQMILSILMSLGHPIEVVRIGNALVFKVGL